SAAMEASAGPVASRDRSFVGQAWIRRAWRRRLAAAQPNNVAIRISPARTLRASSAGREVAGDRRRLTSGSAAEGWRRFAAAVSLTASVRSGLTGPDLMATRRRLVSEGKCRGPRLSRREAIGAQIAAIASNRAATTPKAGNRPWVISIQRNNA